MTKASCVSAKKTTWSWWRKRRESTDEASPGFGTGELSSPAGLERQEWDKSEGFFTLCQRMCHRVSCGMWRRWHGQSCCAAVSTVASQQGGSGFGADSRTASESRGVCVFVWIFEWASSSVCTDKEVSWSEGEVAHCTRWDKTAAICFRTSYLMRM